MRWGLEAAGHRVVALVLLTLASPVQAATLGSASVPATAAVTIYAPITVTQTTGLDFGAVTSGADGAVAIDPGGTRAVSGGVGAVASNLGKPGLIILTGRPNAAIAVTVSPALAGFSEGIVGMTRVGALPTVLTGGAAAFPVGGVLTIPANTPSGVYTGTYSVLANYP